MLSLYENVRFESIKTTDIFFNHNPILKPVDPIDSGKSSIYSEDNHMKNQINQIGFWDYTCPRHGSLERYSQADWDILLDDIAVGGFIALLLIIKWLTTGYRAHLPWLDQYPSCSASLSNNALIYHALRAARQRGLHTWILVVATIFPRQQFDFPGGSTYWTPDWGDEFVV
jgi:hypothetical protein